MKIPCPLPRVIPSPVPAWYRAVFGSLDPDAAAFIAATGATDIEGIENWVKGIQALGYWSNMASYPMRESQNHISTAALRMLGGYGDYPGTLVNGPTRGARGIVCTAGSSQRVSINMPTVFPRSMMFFREHSLVSGSSGTSDSCGAFTPGRFVLNANSTSSFRSGYTSVMSVAQLGPSMSCFSAILRNADQNLYLNDSLSSSGSATGDTTGKNENVTRALGLDNMSGVTGTLTCPMTIFFEGVAVDHAAVYNLYKATLGKGLGLP